MCIFHCAFIISNKINTDRRSFRSIDSKTIHKGKSNNVVSTQRSSDLWIFRRFQLFKRLVYCLNCLYVKNACFSMYIYFTISFWKVENVWTILLKNKIFIRWKNEERFKNGSLIAQCVCCKNCSIWCFCVVYHGNFNGLIYFCLFVVYV